MEKSINRKITQVVAVVVVLKQRQPQQILQFEEVVLLDIKFFQIGLDKVFDFL